MSSRIKGKIKEMTCKIERKFIKDFIEDWKEDYWVDTIVILNLIPIILATISLLHRN